jgi:hypothetical protein
MRRRLAAVPVLILLAAGAAQPTAAARPRATQTQAQAEIHLLRIVPQTWNSRRMPGLVDAETHVLVDNTQAVCNGRGKRYPHGWYSRFLCVVRPAHHTRRAGLYVSYRARADGTCECHWLAYRRH